MKASAANSAEQIAKRNRMFEEAYNSGDARRLVESYFAPEAQAPFAVPPGAPPVRGRANLTGMFSAMFSDTPKIQLETVEVTASDEVTFELGRAYLSNADGSKVTGRYVVCWVATDDGWRAKTDFFAGDGWDD